MRLGKNAGLSILAFTLIIVIQQAAYCQGKLHVIIIADTHSDGLEEGIKSDVRNVTAFFKTAIPQNQLKMHPPIEGRDCNRKTILRRVKNIRTTGDDRVMCYYSGHGAYDPNVRGINNFNRKFKCREFGQQHFLALPGPDLLRKDLLNQFIDRKPRPQFTLLITDCCNKAAPGAAPASAFPMVKSSPTAMHLFFKYRGWMNFTASRPDQYAIGPATGGIFTDAFIYELKRHDQRMAENRNLSPPDWKEFFMNVRSSTQDRFAPRSDQRTQTPYMFSTFANKNGKQADIN